MSTTQNTTTQIEKPSIKHDSAPSQMTSITMNMNSSESSQMSKNQRRKAAKARAAEAKAAATKTTQEESFTEAIDQSVPNWRASLTMDQLKELKRKEGQAKHAALHPPRPIKQEGQESAAPVEGSSKVGTSPSSIESAPKAKDSSMTQAATSLTPKPPASSQLNAEAKPFVPGYHGAAQRQYQYPNYSQQASVSNATQNTNDTTYANSNAKAKKARSVVSGCGFKDCPVKASHAARVYKVDDPQFPNFIKKTRADHDKGEYVSFAKHDAFFKVHEMEARKSKEEGESAVTGFVNWRQY